MPQSPMEAVHECEELVVNVVCDIFEENASKPYLPAKYSRVTGSGYVFCTMFEREVWVVTNAHVVDKAHAVFIRTEKMDADETSLKCRVCAVCTDRDLAMLACTVPSELLPRFSSAIDPKVVFCDDLELTKGARVMVAGFPLGVSNMVVTDGIVSGFPRHDPSSSSSYSSYSYSSSPSALSKMAACSAAESGRYPVRASTPLVQISAAVNPGNSGGPLLAYNAQAKTFGVYGIVVASKPQFQNTAFVLPSRVVLAVLTDMVWAEMHLRNRAAWGHPQSLATMKRNIPIDVVAAGLPARVSTSSSASFYTRYGSFSSAVNGRSKSPEGGASYFGGIIVSSKSHAWDLGVRDMITQIDMPLEDVQFYSDMFKRGLIQQQQHKEGPSEDSSSSSSSSSSAWSKRSFRLRFPSSSVDVGVESTVFSPSLPPGILSVKYAIDDQRNRSSSPPSASLSSSLSSLSLSVPSRAKRDKQVRFSERPLGASDPSRTTFQPLRGLPKSEYRGVPVRSLDLNYWISTQCAYYRGSRGSRVIYLHKREDMSKRSNIVLHTLKETSQVFFGPPGFAYYDEESGTKVDPSKMAASELWSLAKITSKMKRKAENNMGSSSESSSSSSSYQLDLKEDASIFHQTDYEILSGMVFQQVPSWCVDAFCDNISATQKLRNAMHALCAERAEACVMTDRLVGTEVRRVLSPTPQGAYILKRCRVFSTAHREGSDSLVSVVLMESRSMPSLQDARQILVDLFSGISKGEKQRLFSVYVTYEFLDSDGVYHEYTDNFYESTTLSFEAQNRLRIPLSVFGESIHEFLTTASVKV